MLPIKPRQLLYALVMLIFFAVGTTAIANTKVHAIFTEVASAIKQVASPEKKETAKIAPELKEATVTKGAADISAAATVFGTIIQGADAQVTCSNDGATVARFILCGDSDDRNITLSGGPYSSVSWRQLTSGTPNTNVACPDPNLSHYTEVANTQSFNMLAAPISAVNGAEFVVIADGQRYYIEVVKSTITQTYTKKDFVCNNPGRIEITGLPNNYQFRIREGSGGFGPYQSSSIFPNLDPGFYTVQTRLNIAGSVCEYLYETIEIKQVDIEIGVTFSNPVCSGETGSIDVTVNPEVPGPYVYTLLDENGAEIEFTSTISSNNYTFGAVGEGTYAIRVETNDCKEDIPNGIVAPIQYTDTSGNPIVVGTGLDPISVVTDTNGMSFGCSTIPSVDIDVTPSGGSGTYSYTVSDGGNSGGNFTGTSSYTVTNPGTYTFFITDDHGCTAEKSEYVAELSPPDVTATDIIGTCTNGGGKVKFNVTNPRGFNLEYRATNNAGDLFTSSSTIPVPDGTYSIIEVRYSQGAFNCTLTLPAVTVTSAGGLTSSASLTQDYTCGNGEGIIDFVAASGGSGSGYEYSVDNVIYQSGTTFGGLTPGSTYIPYVKDGAGCYQALAPITITEPVPPTNVIFIQDDLDCASGTSRVTIDVQPASFSVAQYAIISSNPATTLPPAQPGNVFPGLDLDTFYQFEITDANGCTYTENFTTGGFSSIRAQVKSGGDRKVCPGAADGTGAFLIDGFDSTYDYIVTYTPTVGPSVTHSSGTGANNFEIGISGLGAGNYEISASDTDTHCISMASFNVVEPTTALSVSANVTDMSCQNGNVGRVQASGSNGFGGYRYQLQWPSPSTTNQGPKTGKTFSNLTVEGEYILTVIDSEGCTAETRFTLTNVTPPTITLDTADYCYSATNDGEITVTSAAGTAALSTHQYRINDGPLQTPGTAGTFTFSNLVPGNYTIEVVDDANCSASLPTVIIPHQVQVTLSINREIPCGNDGEMEISINGGDISNLGTTSYTIEYESVTPPSPYTPVVGHTVVPLPSGAFQYTVPYANDGNYRVTVTDSNGCTNISDPITFIEPTNITATERIVGPSCGDPNSGFVEIIPTVSSGIPPFEVVFAPAPTPGVLVADPNTPDPTFTYSFSSQTIYSGLPAGFYEYVVKDARDCVTSPVTRIEVMDDGVAAVDANITPIDATCSTGNLSGGVTINPMVSPGVPNYTITIEDNFGNPFVTLSDVAPGDLPLPITDASLVPGNYQVIVVDSRGCIDQEPLVIGTINLDIIPNLPTAPIVCMPGGTTICVDIVNGSGNYEIRLVTDPTSAYQPPNNTPTRHCFSNLLYGVSYTVEVRDTSTGCTYQEVITLPDSPGMDVDLLVDGLTCRNGNVGVNYIVNSGMAPFDVVITNLDTGTVVYDIPGSSLMTLTTALSVPAGRYGVSVVDSATPSCSGGDEGEAILNLPRVDVIDNQNANCNELGQLTVRANGGTAPYEYAFVLPLPPGTIPAPSEFNSSPTASLAGSLTGTTYDIWVMDAGGCPARTSAAVIQLNPVLPAPTISVNNQCDVAPPPTGWDITIEMPGDIDTPTFTLNGISQTPVYTPGTPTQATFNVGSIGSYPVNVIDANGCDVDAVAEVFQVLSASGDFLGIGPNCENPDGTIRINANGGSGDFSYILTGNDFLGNPIIVSLPNEDDAVDFTNIPPGDYQVVVTDNQVTNGTINCTFTVDGIVRSRPIRPVIDDTGESDVSCNGLNDGSIGVSLVIDPVPANNPTIKEYNLYNSDLASMPGNYDFASRIGTTISGAFAGLAPGTYVVEVVTDRNCFDRREVTIVDPPVFGIEVGADPLVCNPNANQYSTTWLRTTFANSGADIGNGAPYGYKIDPTDSYQTSPDFLIVDTGSDQTITVYAIDANGCESIDTITVLSPNEVTATITQLRPMDCELPERIQITVTGSSNFVIEDQGASVASVSDVSGTSVVEFDLPQVAGEYRLRINDVGGCTYPLVPYIVTAPILPTVSISQNEPVGCLGDTDGILNIEVTNLASLTGFTGYEYTVYDAADPGFSGGFFGTPVAGNSTGTFDIATDGNPATITGLPTGNLRVVIREQGKTAAACSVFSDASFIDTPSEQLRITTLEEIGRVGCSNDLGEIVATTVGGWDSSPYEYMLEYDDGSGFAPSSNPSYATFAANGNNNRFTGLSSGNYRVTVRDIEGCVHFEERELFPVPAIQADAVVTRDLECPTGADAIIVAVEPGTITPGAIGGVPGGGYQYRLIKLDPNNLDPTDAANHIGSSGFQNEPEFEGASGTGVISGGWYAIEIVSTLNCQSFTAPVQVVPPPAIAPALIQTAVPACGNIAEMMIRVNNPQGGTYEFRRIYQTTHPLYTDPSIIPWEPVDGTDANGLPVKTSIPGNIGESYRYEVRKNGSSSSCLARKTNGITITDAEPLSLDPTSPTFNVSCAYEVDGRIEAIAKGGTGIYEFRIYNTDPGTDAFVAEPLPTYGNRSVQAFGTFENLDAGDYWISVISRQNCGVVQGPFSIAPAAPVIIANSATPTTCFGETDGTITMNVTSATAGLVKFSIEPNLSEFFTDPDDPMTYTFTDLEGDRTYTVLAQDAEGCPQTFEIYVGEPDELKVTDVATTPETCIAATDGTAQITIAGGTPLVDPITLVPYYETKLMGPGSDGSEVFERNDNLFFDNLAGGVSYLVFIQDANMCETFVEVPIEIGVDLTAEPIVQYGCEGIFPNSTARVELQDNSRISEILFALDPIDPTDAVTALATTERSWGDLPVGDHIVYIYHENGCTNTVEFSIETYAPLTLDAQKTGPNELTAIAAGGFGGYEYFFNGESYGSEGIYTTTESGIVEVRVVDQNGCVAVASIPFEFTGMLELPNFFTPNGDNENDFWSPKNREFFPNIEVIIYDRYGRVVAELNQVSEWDGLYDGKELPSGDYWYVVNQNDKRSTRYVGHFTLYR